MVVTCKLTGNRRDIYTASPKALLIDLDESIIGRKHCWVDLHLVESIQPRGHQKPRTISFECKLKPYLKQGKITQYTLKSIKNIQLI